MEEYALAINKLQLLKGERELKMRPEYCFQKEYSVPRTKVPGVLLISSKASRASYLYGSLNFLRPSSALVLKSTFEERWNYPQLRAKEDMSCGEVRSLTQGRALCGSRSRALCLWLVQFAVQCCLDQLILCWLFFISGHARLFPL